MPKVERQDGLESPRGLLPKSAQHYCEALTDFYELGETIETLTGGPAKGFRSGAVRAAVTSAAAAGRRLPRSRGLPAGSPVAVKLLVCAPEEVAAVVEEGLLLLEIQHPAIVRLYDLFVYPTTREGRAGRPAEYAGAEVALVMELGTYRRPRAPKCPDLCYLRHYARARVPQPVLCRWLYDLAYAMDALHSGHAAGHAAPASAGPGSAGRRAPGSGAGQRPSAAAAPPALGEGGQLLHRDVKIENVFLFASDGAMGEEHRDWPLIKLGDFGISKVVEDAAAPRAHTFVGTPQYFAPELTVPRDRGAGDSGCDDGGELDGPGGPTCAGGADSTRAQPRPRAVYSSRADIYAAGLTIFFMATCGPQQAPVKQVGAAAPDRERLLAQLEPGAYDPPLVALLRAMLAPAPEERPSAAELLQDSWLRARAAEAGADVAAGDAQAEASAARLEAAGVEAAAGAFVTPRAGSREQARAATTGGTGSTGRKRRRAGEGGEEAAGNGGSSGGRKRQNRSGEHAGSGGRAREARRQRSPMEADAEAPGDLFGRAEG